MPLEESDFDFDPQNSDFTIGIEVEYPGLDPSEDKKFISRGNDTNSLTDIPWPSTIGGRAVYDGTVGLEVVSDPLDLADAPQWYADVIEHVTEEHNTPYQPVGLMKGGSTAGMHVHLSSLSESQARELYEISQTTWAKVLFCSSIATDDDSATWPVFRGGSYCRMNFGSEHYDCVNSRGGGRYEWRLPEPMVPEHMEILVKFLRLFEQSPDAAREYAQEILDDADDRITSIKRAEAVGMDIDTVPTVTRSPHPESEDFYMAVSDEWAAPEIYRVNHDDGTFYVFQTRFEGGTFDISGYEFSPNDVLRADTLEPVDDSEYTDDIQRAFQRYDTDELRETEATDELKKIVKKKKGKPIDA